MTSGSFRFDRFYLDPDERKLLQDGEPVEINGRYLDALALMVRERGRLVTKDRFLTEVWRGVPVTDEALTQCVKTLRRQLGDEAARPRFIETVPKHGYRFIAPVDFAVSAPAAGEPAGSNGGAVLLLGGAGTIGGGWAGLLGGLFYGFTGASQPLQPGMGAVSILLVLVSITILVGLIGGAGVSFGIALAVRAKGRSWYWLIMGGAVGGLMIGGAVKLLGLDAFTLLLGRSPGDITGAFEGLILGAAVGLAYGLADRAARVRRGAAIAALLGGAAGLVIILAGGRLMAGSLVLLAQQFPDSRLRLDQIGWIFGESGLGPVSRVVTGSLEGALFAGCVVGAMILARRSRTSAPDVG